MQVLIDGGHQISAQPVGTFYYNNVTRHVNNKTDRMVHFIQVLSWNDRDNRSTPTI